MPNKPTTLREWKKELRNKFAPHDIVPHWKAVDDEIGNDVVCYPELETFIDELLTSHNTELVSKIEGMRREPKFIAEDIELFIHWKEVGEIDGYNRALDEVIKLINQEE